jgi:nucleotide-binding universal stress UspA family protein
MRYQSLLVPLDGSAFSEQALPLAARIARLARARLRVVRVHAPLLVVDGIASVYEVEQERTREQERSYLAGVARRLEGLAGVPVESPLRSGRVADALHDEAVATGADLVVMCTHGRGALSRLWDVTLKVLRNGEVKEIVTQLAEVVAEKPAAPEPAPSTPE